VSAIPAGAAIIVDGVYAAEAPARVAVSPGDHSVELVADGYASYRMTAELACGASEDVSVEMYDNTPPSLVVEELPSSVYSGDGLKVTATSSDNSQVASMALFIDDQMIFQLQGDRLRHNLDTRALALGEHVLRIEALDVAGNARDARVAFAIQGDEAPRYAVEPTATTAATSERVATVAPVPLPTETSAPAATPSLTPLAAVAVYEDELSILVDDYLPALYTDVERTGQPYPLVNHDLVGPPSYRTFRTIILQNQYLEIVILPEMGGRIYQCRFLPTNQPLLYNSRVAKVTRWGPTDQGWWLALGGMEFALPVEEHGYLTAQPWDASVSRQPDGSATVALQVQEETRGILARVEVTLKPGEAAIRLRTQLRNTTGAEQVFQYWTNAMLSPGRHGVGPELSIAFPADQVVIHSRGDTSLPSDGATMPWPLYAGRDMSAYGEWRDWLGFFGPARTAPFMAVYDRATQIGMVQATAEGILPGAKIFGFGREFNNDTFSEDGAQYVEMWSGVAPTFSQDVSLPEGGVLSWDEIWYVVAQSDGVTFANQNASLYAWRDGEVLRLTVASPADHRWRLVITQGGTPLGDEVFDVQPGTPFRFSADFPGGGSGEPVHIEIRDLADNSILEYVY